MEAASDNEQTKTDLRKLLELIGDGARVVPNYGQDALRFLVFSLLALDRVVSNHAVLPSVDLPLSSRRLFSLITPWMMFSNSL